MAEEFIPKKNEFCPIPFQEMEIHHTGDVFLCCPHFNNFYSCGNIFENSFEEVWNSEKAISFRTRIMNGDYSLCDKETCYICSNKDYTPEFETSCMARMIEYPKRIKFCYDRECNLACVICRNKVDRLTEEELNKWNEKIDSLFIPMLKDASILTVNTNGEAFASRHSRKLIKAVAEKYPNIKFEFLTNGVLCNEQAFKDLNVKPENIYTIRVSMHAATKKTYSKMVKNGHLYYDKLIKNLEYLSELKKKYNFMFYFNFVVTSLNYQDMPKFVELAQRYGASPKFWEYRMPQDPDSRDEDLNIRDGSENYKNLKKVLKHPNMYIYSDCLYPQLKKSQENNPKYSLLEKIQLKLGIY